MAIITDLNAKRAELNSAIDTYKQTVADFNDSLATQQDVDNAKAAAIALGDEYAKLTAQVKQDDANVTNDDQLFSNPSMMGSVLRGEVSEIMRTGSATKPTVWNIDTRDHTDPSNVLFTLPVAAGSNVEVDWGDGTIQTITGPTTHSYPTAGLYEVKFNGSVNGFDTYASSQRDLLQDVSQWGSTEYITAVWMFRYRKNFTITATDSPIFLPEAQLSDAFYSTTGFNSNINHWDVSNVVSLWSCFAGNSTFNQPLDQWDVSGVRGFSHTFYNATAFDQDLSGWNTASAANNTNFAANCPINGTAKMPSFSI